MVATCIGRIEMKDILLKEMTFIAEHKYQGYKVEFMIYDLYGFDDESILIHADAYVCGVWDLIPRDIKDERFEFRLKRENESGDIIRPIEFISATVTEDLVMKIECSNNETVLCDFTHAPFAEKLKDRFDEFVLKSRIIIWGDEIELRYVDLWRYKMRNK